MGGIGDDGQGEARLEPEQQVVEGDVDVMKQMLADLMWDLFMERSAKVRLLGVVRVQAAQITALKAQVEAKTQEAGSRD